MPRWAAPPTSSSRSAASSPSASPRDPPLPPCSTCSRRGCWQVSGGGELGPGVPCPALPGRLWDGARCGMGPAVCAPEDAELQLPANRLTVLPSAQKTAAKAGFSFSLWIFRFFVLVVVHSHGMAHLGGWSRSRVHLAAQGRFRRNLFTESAVRHCDGRRREVLELCLWRPLV